MAREGPRRDAMRAYMGMLRLCRVQDGPTAAGGAPANGADQAGNIETVDSPRRAREAVECLT